MGSSKKEEERIERTIRGLMKLPPNRRCINCNTLGPQYVCITFWTFVCTTCSGIHREFTHRVKSVSMSKFTHQEVDSLQKGGNQCAREMFFNAWDTQKQRFPDNSNTDSVREFIKDAYVGKRYAKGRSDARLSPLLQRNGDEGVRRADSYHSYSQSPPRDYQYEERRYGKRDSVLTRRASGSDNNKGADGRRTSSFISHCSGDDRLSLDGSFSRASTSSGGSWTGGAGLAVVKNTESHSFAASADEFVGEFGWPSAVNGGNPRTTPSAHSGTEEEKDERGTGWATFGPPPTRNSDLAKPPVNVLPTWHAFGDSRQIPQSHRSQPNPMTWRSSNPFDLPESTLLSSVVSKPPWASEFLTSSTFKGFSAAGSVGGNPFA